MRGRWAGSPVSVCVRVRCREPKTGQEKIQSDQCLIYLLFLSHNQTVYSMYFEQYLATYCVVHEQ